MEGVGRQNWARGRIPIFRKIHLYGKSVKSTHGHTKKKPTQPFFRDLAVFQLPRLPYTERTYPTAKGPTLHRRNGPALRPKNGPTPKGRDLPKERTYPTLDGPTLHPRDGPTLHWTDLPYTRGTDPTQHPRDGPYPKDGPSQRTDLPKERTYPTPTDLPYTEKITYGLKHASIRTYIKALPCSHSP